MLPVNSGRSETVGKLKESYSRFFDKMNGVVIPETGDATERGIRGEPHRFACYPYVGSSYGESRRILFVGRDYRFSVGEAALS